MIVQVSTKHFASPHVFLVLLLFMPITVSLKDHSAVKCIERERLALLEFKAGLVDDYGRLSTWGTKDCCEWRGVQCDNRTNQVVALNLQGPYSKKKEYPDDRHSDVIFESQAPLRGKISNSLLKLVGLSHLDLSYNDFYDTKIPKYLGSFKELQHLNLSHSKFIGTIPYNLGNLSMLQVLDLSRNDGISATNLNWVTSLSSLQHLDLSHTNLRIVTTWVHAISKLTKLKKLYLRECGMQESVSTSPFSSINSTNSLVVLDLSKNSLKNNLFFLWFIEFSSSITYIDISGNDLEGKIPDSLTKLVSLAYVDLSGNNLDGRIPDSLWNMKSLSNLYLSENNLEGEFPLFSGNLRNLISLDLSSNNLEGDLSHMTTLLWNSTKLEYLYLDSNRFYGSVPHLSRFYFLDTVSFRMNQLNGSFTESILRLPHLVTLDTSGNLLSGGLPNFALCSSLKVLSLSNNKFNATVTERHLSNLSKLEELSLSFNLGLALRINPHWNATVQLVTLDLAGCNLGPNFPTWLHNQRKLTYLDISNSEIYDSVPTWFWNKTRVWSTINMSHNHIYGGLPEFSSPEILILDLSSNEFNGSLPVLPSLSIVDLSRNRLSGTIKFPIDIMTMVLDLSDNLLSGKLSGNCFEKLMNASYVDLANNNLFGEIPDQAGAGCSISSLNLRNNSFTGQLPTSLRECKQLEILDLGHNHLTGEIPSWIGENMLKLGVLSLMSNEFHGSVPTSLCHLTSLQILDLSENKISGIIPRCLNNFTYMCSKQDSNPYSSVMFLHRLNLPKYATAYMMWKGQDVKYSSTLEMVKAIDMSSNNLVGSIPPEITTLLGLIALNLSRNNLTGSIPRDIAKLELLNFLDLSANNLSGSIPDSLSELSHLGVLNLSFNNLSGRIPWRTHLQTFDSWAYTGNAELCGPPLSKPCPGYQPPHKPKDTSNNAGATDHPDQEDKFITRGFYVSMAIGFVIAFWGTFGSLTFNRSCMVGFSMFYTGWKDWMYVMIAVNKNRLQRYYQNE